MILLLSWRVQSWMNPIVIGNRKINGCNLKIFSIYCIASLLLTVTSKTYNSIFFILFYSFIVHNIQDFVYPFMLYKVFLLFNSLVFITEKIFLRKDSKFEYYKQERRCTHYREY